VKDQRSLSGRTTPSSDRQFSTPKPEPVKAPADSTRRPPNDTTRRAPAAAPPPKKPR
jgi:hypothetical protein